MVQEWGRCINLNKNLFETFWQVPGPLSFKSFCPLLAIGSLVFLKLLTTPVSKLGRCRSCGWCTCVCPDGKSFLQFAVATHGTVVMLYEVNNTVQYRNRHAYYNVVNLSA